jgi:signal transduction histidine kinase
VFARTRWHLVGWTMLVVGLILVVLGGAVYAAMSGSILAQVDRHLASRAAQALDDPRAIMGGAGGLEGGRFRAGAFYLLVDGEGRVLANPQRVDTDGLELAQAAGSPRVGATAELGGEPVRLYAEPFPGEPGGPLPRPGPSGRSGPGPGPRGARPPFGVEGLVLVVGQSLAPERRALDLLLLILGVGGLAGLGLSFAGAWFLAGRALVPIQEAFRRQQEFVADASHELRTPLTVLRAATDLLAQHRDQPLSANGELFEDVRTEIGRLQRLTQDLLTLARSDRGQLELAVAPLDLGVLAGEVARRVEPLAAERGIGLSCRAAGTAAVVEADPDRLQQVLLILLDNAIKHTPAGGRVAIDVGVQDGCAQVEVADTGPGIAPAHLPRVFERFYRIDAARSQGRPGDGGGAGLGLAIAKSLVEAHGGELTLTSRQGEGTRATVRLPTEGASRSLPARLGGLAARIAHRPADDRLSRRPS